MSAMQWTQFDCVIENPVGNATGSAPTVNSSVPVAVAVPSADVALMVSVTVSPTVAVSGIVTVQTRPVASTARV
jgi:hypothetical protein